MEALNKIWIAILLGLLVYIGFAIYYLNVDQLISALQKFRIELIPLLLVLVSAGYIFRFMKWNYLLKSANVELGTKENLFVFFSGLSMTVTPAKVGEIWRSFLIKEMKGISLGRTVPVVIVDRLTDVFSLVFYSSLGIFFYRQGIYGLAFMLILLLGFMFVLKQQKIFKLLNKLAIRRFGYIALDFKELGFTFSALLKLRKIVVATIYGLSAWFLECLTFYLIISGFHESLYLSISIFIFSFASLLGAVSFVPGGLGVAEVTFAGLLCYFGISLPSSVGITLITRLVTLWYGTFVGIAVFLVFKRNWEKFKK
jgi:uncharacterized protein (TIRG00374 family)